MARTARMQRAARWAMALLAGLCMAALAGAEPRIEAITGSQQGSGEVIQIELSAPLTTAPASFATTAPARIALDFAGVGSALPNPVVQLDQSNVRSAQVAQAAGRTRVVLNLTRASPYETTVHGNRVFVTLAPAAAAPSAARETVGLRAQSDAGLHALRDIDFRRGAENAGRVVITMPSAQEGVGVDRQGNALVLSFRNTRLPEGLHRRMDVADFDTPVQIVSARQAGDQVQVRIEALGSWEYNTYQKGAEFVAEIRRERANPNKLAKRPGFHGDKLSLNFQNISVRSLLQVIADFTGFNVVTSDSVQGNLTLRLKDVPWDQALDIILQAKDLGMKRTGNVLWIAPQAEMAAKEKAELEAQASIRDLEPLQTESFQLNYTKAAEIKNQLSGSGSGSGGGGTATLLSPRGSVIAEPRTNQLFVTDIPSRLEKVREMIAKLDIPVRQVLIEARIVEATDTFGRTLGVRLGGADLRGIRGGDAGYALGGGNRVAFGGNYDAISNTTGQTPTGFNAISSQFINLPADTSTIAPGVAPSSFALSLFSSSANRFLNLELSALEADGKGRIISSPRVVTADQTKAIIEQGTEFPYQEATSSGATAVTFRKAVLKLEVTPQITPEGNIILDLDVNKDSPGQELIGGVAINTKRVNTQVLVENGGTVVIGGIFELTENNSENKVPLLGDIPVLGHLFKQNTKVANKQELLVFVTPKVVSHQDLLR